MRLHMHSYQYNSCNCHTALLLKLLQLTAPTRSLRACVPRLSAAFRRTLPSHLIALALPVVTLKLCSRETAGC
jgi:hypothetical protein